MCYIRTGGTPSLTKFESFYVVTFFLCLSLTLHFGFFWGLTSLPTEPSLSESVPVEITFRSEEKNKQQFVTDPDLGKLADKLNEQSRFLSKYARRVKEESVASLSGPTVNKVPQQQSHTKSQPEFQHNQEKKIARGETSGLDFHAEQRQIDVKNNTSRNFSASTIAEHIPNVKRGGFTVLNTDQFTYYSFFHRINEQIRLRWVGKIRRISLSLHPKMVNQLALLGRETRVELVLDSKGEYVSTFIDQGSGAEPLDRAAAEALIEAAPYLNPPQDLVDNDGFIRLNYSFFVEWESRHLARER